MAIPSAPAPDSSSAPPDASGHAARRRAILQGLGKGSAALAALSPLASEASRTHKLANSDLTPAFGYCTVSGFQSAVISGASSVIVCGAFAPSRFLTATTLNYSSLASPLNDQKLADALNSRYGLTGANQISQQTIGSTLRATTPAKLVVTARSLVIRPGTVVGTGIELRAATATNSTITGNFPAGLSPLGNFVTLFANSADTRNLLEVLYDGVVSASPASANCYFLSAYMSVGLGGVTLPASVTKSYIVSSYKVGGYANSTNEYKFFQALCKTV